MAGRFARIQLAPNASDVVLGAIIQGVWCNAMSGTELDLWRCVRRSIKTTSIGVMLGTSHLWYVVPAVVDVTVVTLSSVSGCVDAFPSTGDCSQQEGPPLVLKGSGFSTLTADVYLAIEFVGAPTVLCEKMVILGDDRLKCTAYTGNGTLGTLVLRRGSGVVVASTTTATLSFLLTPPCPKNVYGLCSGHGVCRPSAGGCVCNAEPVLGYWSGPACDECSPRAAGIPGCVGGCPVDARGVVCHSKGRCWAGMCTCVDGYGGAACDIECPAPNGVVCSGAGVCSGVTGLCVCNSRYASPSCSGCVVGWSGSACSVRCPVNAHNGRVCGGAGTCANGTCLCDTGTCGVACEHSAASTECMCARGASYYGALCDTECLGTRPNGTVCTGRGSCNRGPKGTGVCKCDAGYFGLECGGECPGGAGLPCSGHGTCTPDTGTCTCTVGYAGSSCSIRCPSQNGTVCSGSGACNARTGLCMCTGGSSGPACEFPSCDVTGCVHGVCNATTGLCKCSWSNTTGYYQGAQCNVCGDGWVGVQCSIRCRVGANGAICGGHGRCAVNGSCLCTGNFAQPACDECVAGFSGPDCAQACPGCASAPCSGNGRCWDGVAGNNTCTCMSNMTNGYWDGSDCSSCAFGYAGLTCTRVCPGFNAGDAVVCSGHGTCHIVTATCICTEGFAGRSCSMCAPGYFGPLCKACPGFASPCSGYGVCSDGGSGSGECHCVPGRGGAGCQYACDIWLGQTCGHGSCVGNGVCNCSVGWRVNGSVCSTCADGLLGANCSVQCTADNCRHGSCTGGRCVCDRGRYGEACTETCPGGVDRPCNDRGVCDPLDGSCSCYADSLRGHWAGTTCSTCAPAYMSSTCTVPCPVVDGAFCNKRGVCFNGACLNCAPLSSDTDLALVCGSSCELTNVACLPSTPCELGQWGPNCTGVCPGTLNMSYVTCSGHGLCHPYTGECSCDSSYFGEDCSLLCPRKMVDGASVTCGGHGTCVGGRCLCDTGYFGELCDGECPGGVNSSCSGRGTCDTGTGMCTCAPGFVGRSCAIVCPGPLSVPCFGHGACGVTGACTCFSGGNNGGGGGYYSGSDCSTCAVGYVGTECNVPCPYCSVNGRCLLTTPTTAGCACDADYYGAACTVHCTTDLCIAQGIEHPQCSVSGACECQRSVTAGRWDGPTCSVCDKNYWGLACTFACMCNGHGACNAATGVCICYGDATEGYWSGTRCDVCQSGYVGQDCKVQNVQITMIPMTLGATLDNPRYGSSGGGVMIVDGNVSICGVNPLVVLSPSSTLATISFGSDGVAVNAEIFNATTYRFLVMVNGQLWESFVGRSSYRVLSLGAARSATGGSSTERTVVATKSSTDQYGVLESLGCAVTITRVGGGSNTTMLLFSCSSYQTTVTMTGGPVTAVRDVNDGVHCVVSNGTAMQFIAVRDGTLRGVTQINNGSVFCAPTKWAHTALCVLDDPVAIRAMFVDKTTGRVGVAMELYSGGYTTTALLTIVEQDFAFVGLSSRTVGASLLLKIQLGTLKLSGVQMLAVSGGTFSIATRLTVSESSPGMLWAVLQTAFSVRTVGYLLFGLSRVTPNVVDHHGGALLTVIGEGFAIGGDIRCIFREGEVSNATVVNSTVALCRVPYSENTTSNCIGFEFEIAVHQRRTSGSNVLLMRPPTAIVVPSPLSSVDGRILSCPVGTPCTLVVTGDGFVVGSDGAACRIVDGGGVVLESIQVVVVNATAVQCTFPPATRESAPPALLHYSHDGGHFGSSGVPAAVVGSPRGLVALIAGTTMVRAAAILTLPPVTVKSVDRNGNVQGAFDSTVRVILCNATPSSLLHVQDLMMLPTCRTVANGGLMVRGVALVSGVALVMPRVGRCVLHCYEISSNLISQVTFVIDSGTPTSLRLAVDVATILVGVREAVTLQPQPVVVAVDAADNVVNDVRQLPEWTTVNYVTVGDDRTQGVTTSSTVRSDGTYVFQGLRIRAYFGQPPTLKFSALGLKTLAVVLPKLELCELSSYGVRGTATCAPCPMFGICDGSPVVAGVPGAWRAISTSYVFYGCTPAAACPGEAQCAPAYTGAVCGACAPGYGYSLSSCDSCGWYVANWALITILFAGLVFVVYHISMDAIRSEVVVAAARKNKAAQETTLPIIWKMLLSHIQILTLISPQELPLSPWVKSVVHFSSTASAMELNFAFLSCELARNAIDTMWMTIACIPLLIAAVSVVYFVRHFGEYQSRLLDTIVIGAPEIAFEAPAELYRMRLRRQRGLPTENGNDERDKVRRLREVTRNRMLLVDEEADAVVRAGHVADDARAVHPLKVLAIVFVVVLYLLYTTVVKYASRLVPCQTIDLGNGKTRDYMLYAADIACDSTTYAAARRNAGVVVGMIAIGVPVGCVLLVMLTARLFGGDMSRAKIAFRFTTGGLRDALWFWEAVSLARKAALAILASSSVTLQLRMVGCFWILFVSLLVNGYVRPWKDQLLSDMEMMSFAILALTYGMLSMSLANPNYNTAVSIVVIVSSIGATILFIGGILLSIGQSLRDDVDPAYHPVLLRLWLSLSARRQRSTEDEWRALAARLRPVANTANVIYLSSRLANSAQRRRASTEEHLRLEQLAARCGILDFLGFSSGLPPNPNHVADLSVAASTTTEQARVESPKLWDSRGLSHSRNTPTAWMAEEEVVVTTPRQPVTPPQTRPDHHNSTMIRVGVEEQNHRLETTSSFVTGDDPVGRSPPTTYGRHTGSTRHHDAAQHSSKHPGPSVGLVTR